MVAVRVCGDQRPAVVGSPEYFASYSKPSTPHDVLSHPMHQPARRLRAAISLGVRKKMVRPSRLTLRDQ